MAVFALTNAFAYVHGHDFTTDINNCQLATDVESLDITTFGSSGWKQLIGGLKSTKLDMTGFWQSATTDSVDSEAFPDLATINRAYTVGSDQTATSPVYMFQAAKFAYALGGKIGEAAPFTLSCYGTDGVGTVRGQLAKAKGTVSATGQLGSVVQLGAPTSTQYVYATVHVFVAATTITIQIQSDDNSGMSSPVTRATIGPLTTTGGTWMTRVAGPFAGEAYWRANVSAITGTFTVGAAIAVQ